ncbi:MAG: hypothetical protein M3Y48_20270 [Actinomycetota bacterium]|nr:hypothetical protein [Actinomycetota bacterium]
MDTKLESEEPERREGIGGRVRRFIDNELNRTLDRKDRATDKGDTDQSDAPARLPEDAEARLPEDTPSRTPGLARPPEPDRPYDDPTGHPGHPLTTTPLEPASDSAAYGSPAYDSPAHDSLAPEPRGETAAGGQVHDRSNTEAAADGSAQRIGLLNDPAGLRDQWQRVQGTFVDDPQRAVHEASVLVDRTLEEIHQNVARGQTGDPTSTEDLRMSFQRYREFFQRLLSA